MKKTEEQIREEAEVFNESLPDDENKSTSEFMELSYLAGYQSSQSLMASEIKESYHAGRKDALLKEKDRLLNDFYSYILKKKLFGGGLKWDSNSFAQYIIDFLAAPEQGNKEVINPEDK